MTIYSSRPIPILGYLTSLLLYFKRQGFRILKIAEIS